MNYLPLFADLTGRPVLVVGGGSVAARKLVVAQSECSGPYCCLAN